MNFSGNYMFQVAGKVIAGINSTDHLPGLVKELNKDRIAIITDMGVWRAGLVEKPKAILESAGISVEVVNHVPPEPELQHVKSICDEVKKLDCDMLIGIGGGSAMDVAKIASVRLTNDIEPEEMVGTGKIRAKGIPMLMIPTTAGTGSETTPNAIVTIPEQELKVGIVSSRLIPDCVILDPMMTVKLPPAITASTGMDALTHALECYISAKANPFSDTFALKAIRLIYGSIKRAYSDGTDLQARHDMLLGSFYGGICIASSGTAAVHALAYPLGGKFRIPHGVSNAILLPHVMEFNIDAIVGRLNDVAAEMDIYTASETDRTAAGKVIGQLYDISRDLNIPSSLSGFGITGGDVDGMAEAASRVTRLLDNNPKKMSIEDIKNIYRKLL